jgi:hypothetical protein
MTTNDTIATLRDLFAEADADDLHWNDGWFWDALWSCLEGSDGVAQRYAWDHLPSDLKEAQMNPELFEDGYELLEQVFCHMAPEVTQGLLEGDALHGAIFLLGAHHARIKATEAFEDVMDWEEVLADGLNCPSVKADVSFDIRAFLNLQSTLAVPPDVSDLHSLFREGWDRTLDDETTHEAQEHARQSLAWAEMQAEQLAEEARYQARRNDGDVL